MAVVATVLDPSGRNIEPTDAGWAHIIRKDGHSELAALQAEVLAVVRKPIDIRPGNRPGQEWYYGPCEDGPSHWLRVVVAFTEDRGIIVTAFRRSDIP